MKKVALVFVLAVFMPSLVLAWLAVRSLRDQQFVLERQQSLLYQGVADAMAKEAEGFLAERQREFGIQAEALTREGKAGDVIAFDERLRKTWPLAEVGFVVSMNGNLLCPSPASSTEARLFCKDNGTFLANREIAEVYWNSTKNSYPEEQKLQMPAVQQSQANQAETNSGGSNQPG